MITSDWSDGAVDMLLGIANEVGCDVTHLLAVMSLESDCRSSAQNKSSSASGLIQWMGPWPRYGYTREQFTALSPEQQMPFLRTYFSAYKGKLTTLPRVYMAVLYPRALFTVKTDADPIFGPDARSQAANIGLDADHDGKVTARDLRACLSRAATRPRCVELTQRVRTRQLTLPKAAPVIVFPTPVPTAPVTQPVPATVVPLFANTAPVVPAPVPYTAPVHVPSKTPLAAGVIVALSAGLSALWALFAHHC